MIAGEVSFAIPLPLRVIGPGKVREGPGPDFKILFALKEGAETAGLTITQFKLLGGVGKSVGLDFDETTAFFTKFIVNLEQLRHGSGTLYDALLKVDVGLLRELSTTKDSARAIDILVAAFARLDNQTDKLKIAQGAGGRAGLQGVRLLDQLAKVGSLPGLEADEPRPLGKVKQW